MGRYPEDRYPMVYLPPQVLTPSGGHQNTYSLQAGGRYPTRMLSCLLGTKNSTQSHQTFTDVHCGTQKPHCQ